MSKLFTKARISSCLRYVSSTGICNGQNKIMHKLLRGSVKRYFPVKVAPDFRIVNVYWVAKGKQSDEVIDELLKSQAGQLRHEISQLKVMGVVPKIQFLKDKHLAQLMEVDLRLADADFGEDYVPTEVTSKLKTELKLHTSLEPHIKEQIMKLDSTRLDEIEETLPPMIHNVLGLNHNDIMEKVKNAMSKSLAIHRLESNDSTKRRNFEASVNETPIVFANAKLQREAFKEFLSKRQLLKLKTAKNKNKYQPEFLEEWEINNEQFFDEQFDEMDHDQEET